jgi:hypothetical protein
MIFAFNDHSKSCNKQMKTPISDFFKKGVT